MAKTPCPTCGRLKARTAERCRPCWAADPLRGPTHHSWKGGKYNNNGYVKAWAPGHPRTDKDYHVLEHILVMEEHLGRYLCEGENVHHKNGVKDDNRIENLELWVVSQPPGARVEDLILHWKEMLERYGH